MRHPTFARRPRGVALRQKTTRTGGSTMRCLRMASVAVAACAAAFLASGACAEELNATQKLGQDLFAQSCGVCHLKPQLTAGLFGPTLSRDSANGDERLMREVIANGSPRMPGFKH